MSPDGLTWPERDYIIMAMSIKQPDFETVMAEIGQFINTTVEGLELGTAHARSYYESRGTHLEPPLASMLTRSLAKEHIREKCGLTIEEFEQEDVALIGLRAKVQRYHVWIWKSPDEKIPNPGPSLMRRLFLDQVQLSLALEGLASPEFNLALIWNTTAEYVLTDTYLALPRSSPKNVKEFIDVHWCHPIPHVETSISPNEEPGQPGEQVTFEPLDSESEDEETVAVTDRPR